MDFKLHHYRDSAGAGQFCDFLFSPAMGGELNVSTGTHERSGR
jgi:hypothetical protein